MAAKATTKSKEQTNGGDTTEERTPLRFDWTPAQFEALSKTTRIGVDELCRKLTARFKEGFTDFRGTNIEFTGRGFETTLIFEKDASIDGTGTIQNLIDVRGADPRGKKASFGDGMNFVSKRKQGKTYELTEETKEILAPIMRGGEKFKNRKWEELVEERRVPAGDIWQPGAERVVLMVKGIDLNRLLQWYYGNIMVTSTSEDENGDVFNNTAEARYNARVGKFLPNGLIMLNIEQFDHKHIDEQTRKENPVLGNTNGLIYY